MFRESEGKKHTHKRIRNKWYQTFRHLSFSPLLLCIQIVQAEFIWWGLVFPPYPRFKRRSKGRPRSPGHTGNGRPCCWASFQHLMKNRFEFTRNSHTRPLVGTTRQGFDLGLKGILGNNNKKNLSNLLVDCWVQIGKWKLHFHQSIWWWEPESDFFSWVHE